MSDLWVIRDEEDDIQGITLSSVDAFTWIKRRLLELREYGELTGGEYEQAVDILNKSFLEYINYNTGCFGTGPYFYAVRPTILK